MCCFRIKKLLRDFWKSNHLPPPLPSEGSREDTAGPKDIAAPAKDVASAEVVAPVEVVAIPEAGKNIQVGAFVIPLLYRGKPNEFEFGIVVELKGKFPSCSFTCILLTFSSVVT